MSLYKYLKEKCLNANLEIKNQNLSIYTFGNVSVIDRKKDVFAIKPSGVPYENLKANDIVILNLKGDVIEGELKPSSDTKTHLYLYKNWKSVGSICHTHSTYAVAWSQALKNIPLLGTTHADHLTHDIPCTEPLNDVLIDGDYEFNTGVHIVDYFKKNDLNYNLVEMVLVGNHGPFSWGKDAEKSVYNSRVLEEIAKIAYLTLQINSKSKRIKKSLIDKHFKRKHGKSAYYGQNNKE